MAIAQTYQAFQPAFWTPKVNWYFQKKLQAKYVCTDYSDALQGGNIVYVPNMTQGFTAAAVLITNGEVTCTALADTKSTITLNQWYGDAFRITEGQADRIGNQYNLVDGYFKTMAYNLADTFDTALFSNISSGTFSVGVTGTAIPSTTLEHAMQIADSQNIPHEDCAWVFSPKAYWKQLANVSKYYTASTFGRPTIPTGFVDILYGIPVLVSNNLPLSATDTQNCLIHKSAIGYIMGPRGIQLTEKSPEALRRTYFADIHYGHTLLNAGRIVKIIGKR
jgi:hypothetical protein